ncbi:ANK1 [Symbiodinium sp. KB8]|nr:ANK1 [Symbiodinium sp. KB8]
MAEPPAPDRAVPVQGPHHRVLIPPDLCLEETIDALQASLSGARVANCPEHVPLRRLVPKAGGHWRRCLGAGELLRAVASRDEVVLRCVLGGSADSPRLPVPPAPIFELLRTDDRGRCALDWARLMGWSEAVGLLTEAMQKALAACQEQAAEEQGLWRAAELVRANLQLSSALQAACGNPLDDEWAEATLATLERAARSGVSAAELAEAQQRLRRAGPEAAASALRRCATGRPLTPDPSAEETDGDVGVSSQHFVHASNRWVGQSPLDRAAACGRADVAEALLLAGAIASEPGQDGRLPLGTACASGHLVVCRLLVKHGANPFQADPASGQTPLMHATKAGREDVTQPTHWGEAVLEALDTADDGGLTPGGDGSMARVGTRSGRKRITGQLLQSRQATVPEPLGLPGSYGALAKTLAARAATLNSVPVFPRSATEIMETHIQESCPRFHSAVCDFRVLDCEFQCASCQRRLRSWLLGPYGNARMQLCPLHGSSPLHCAAAKGDLDLLALLVRFVRDAELEVVNMQGLTPLALACRKGQPGAVRMLLAAGADALTESPRGITPLACAVEGSDVDCARLLLEAGASPLTPNSRGLSAAGLAERLGRGGLVQAFNVHSRVRVNLAAMHRAVLRRDALGLGLLLGDLRSRRRAREVQDAPQATAVEGPAENVPSVPPAAVLKREEGGQSRFVPVWRLEREAEAARDGLETATRDACRSIAALAVFHQTSRASGVTAERAEACSRPAAGSRASSLAHLHLAQPIGGERVHSRLRDERNMRVLEQAVAERTRLRMKASRCSETAEQREFGARILRERTPLRHTLLSFASACGATDCMRLLLQMGASPEFDERVWHAAASVIQTAWRATSAARLAAEAWMPPPRARVVRFRALFAGKQALRIASLQLRRELREARLPLHEAAFAGRSAAVQLLLEAGAQPWRRCQALPEPPPPMAMPRQLVMPAPAAGSGGQTRQAEDVLVRVPRLRSDGRIRPEDDVHGWRDKVVVPQLDFGSLSLSSFESSPWASCHDASDSRSSALPSHQAHEEAAVAASAPSGTGLVTKAMQDGKVGCVTLPRAMFIAETAALGYARLGHRTFVYGDGWDRLDGHMAAIGKALEALRHHTLSRRRAAEACRLARNRRERVAELRRLRAVFSVAIDTSDADSVLACLKQGLPAETTDADSGHNALTMAAAQGCSVVSPASNTRRLLVDVILEEFATDPLGLLNHQAPNGLTPLMAAAARGQDSALVALLRRRPGLNAVASCRHPREGVDQLDRAAPGWGLPWRLVTGATALHAAARFGSSGCVRLLQIAGANSAARTDAGDTPADLARRHGHSATAEVLRAAETGTAVNETSRLLAHGPAAVSPCEWGCGARFTAAEASHHDRECPRRIVPCPLGCEEAGIFACEVVEHCKTACPRRRARCPFGCPEVIPGSQFESHLLQCPRRRGTKHVPSTGGSSRPRALEGLG